MLKKISFYLMVILYVGAGINHFLHPSGYYAIIPPYLPYPVVINILAGIAELVLGVMLLFKRSRQMAAYGIMILLVLFIPAHIYMIQKNGCINEKVCWPAWIAWIRLFPLQFVLIWWAWINRKY